MCISKTFFYLHHRIYHFYPGAVILEGLRTLTFSCCIFLTPTLLCTIRSPHTCSSKLLLQSISRIDDGFRLLPVFNLLVKFN